MNTYHHKHWKIGALGASLVIASTAVTYSGASALSGGAVEQANTATATTTPTPTTTPSFRQADCPVGGLTATETSTPESALTSTPSAGAAQPTEPVASTTYFDGQYSGDAVKARGWGTMQVVAVIDGGKLVDIIIDQYPHATTQSNIITRHALPTLICEAIEAQGTHIDFVSRATDSSRAFVRSLDAALLDAEIGLNL